ncbi:MAG: RNase adapter RapZ [Desulfarculaceae bacterium]|nr:RNase adapter RapZ [Desulfarculaceae bacterium]MCF8047240.1 RNase adapter RapZ [Desulfarculaceae bacterium]MCF8065079.1 RNase adapter RapZ [Desulfarculaceae bacterium]MCF8098497.1 RNase adapter RapZ [Desulfarculaceae bacterium]MCF8122328.1 RNase adapter RapZ [Desulfarculaceae bacterium]
MSSQDHQVPARFVVITGLSGTGKSTALKALEDLGYYAVDNLPVELLPAFVKLPLRHVGESFQAALVMDVRAHDFVERFPRTFLRLANQGHNLELLYLEASDEVLIRRFSQTRRQHPLSGPEGSVREGLDRERALLLPVKELANQIIDTSRFTVHDLRQEVFSLYNQSSEPARMQLNFITFGFKYGLPQEADMVMDVRFLDNPYFVDELRHLDGREPQVVDFIFQGQESKEFLKKFKDLLEFLIPAYQREGKTQLTVALGCTGGHHRSVAVAEWLVRNLTASGVRLTLRHRDIAME